MPQAYRGMVQDAALNNGISTSMLSAMAQAESGFNPNAKSGAGAIGIMQLMPGTAKDLGVSNPLDPAQSLNGGAKYMRQLLNQFGDVRISIAAYNAGPGRVQKAIDQTSGGHWEDVVKYLPAETQNYVEKVMNNMMR